MVMLEGVSLTPLNEILNDKGNIFHTLKSTDETFISFGEAYFSNVNYGAIKGWKKQLPSKNHLALQLFPIIKTRHTQMIQL